MLPIAETASGMACFHAEMLNIVQYIGVGPKGPALERFLDIKKKKIYIYIYIYFNF
jgi:hypothetical protein